MIKCHPELKEHLVSGVFQLADTNLMLQTLARLIKADLNYMTRWWIELSPN